MSAAPRRAATAVAIGNFLEFYNFLIVSTFAPMIGRSLLPHGSVTVQAFGAWSAFAVSFVARPLGAIALGGLAARRGRRAALLASLGLMGLGSALVAFCPGFGRIGWLAAAVTVLGRLLQGFSDGGEVGPASVALLEMAPPRQRMGYVLLQFLTQHAAAAAGVGVGLLLSSLLTEAQLYAWGWRLALALGLAVVPVGLWLRRDIDPGVVTRQRPGPASRADAGRIGLALLTMVGVTSMAYGRAYGVTYGITVLRLHPRAAMAAMALGLLASVAGMAAGLRLTRIFGGRAVTTVALVASVLVCEPLYAWAAADRGWMVLATAQAMIGLAGAMPFAPLLLAMLTAFPAEDRAAGFGLVYALAVAGCGATTPALLSWLSLWDGNPLWPAHIYAAAAIVALVGGLSLLSRGEAEEAVMQAPDPRAAG